jgi:hypothetical protein
MKKPKPKCRICGGHCGKKRGEKCRYAANEAKRRSEVLCLWTKEKNMGFWDFWHQHEFLAWCALWLAWKFCNRLMRTIKVCVRGWPPEHLDADGDWKPEPKHEEAQEA